MKLPNRSRDIAEQYEQKLEQNEFLKSQIGEEETFLTMMRRMARENKVAVVSALVILLLILAAVFAPVLTRYSFSDMDLMHRLAPPGAEHLFGTDEAGRDILTRLLYGARVSLLTGVVPTIMSMLLGALLGVAAGYCGGWLDDLIMRIADITLAFPSMLLAMVMMYMLGDGLINVFLTLALVNWASVARIVRAQTLQLKKTEYVEAARVIGVSRGKIIFRHLLPNCLPTMIVLFTLNVPSAILTESSLSFLGLGIQPPAASWGLMVNSGRQYLYLAPWVSLVPSAAIMISVLAFNFLGDGLRDVMDPYQKR
ncbi:MAG TPA: ABC transporter permease [Lachnospiraceae bacterium]|nr:ABC transporter permease [Lachnospiraceae bacterium]